MSTTALNKKESKDTVPIILVEWLLRDPKPKLIFKNRVGNYGEYSRYLGQSVKEERFQGTSR